MAKTSTKTATKLTIDPLKMNVVVLYKYIDSADSYIPADATADEVIEKIAKLSLDDGVFSRKWHCLFNPEKSEWFMDCLDVSDADEIKSQGVKIDLRAKDMPTKLNIVNGNMHIKCDYKNGAVPKLGENCFIFHESIIMFSPISPITNRKSVEIGDNVILGAGTLIGAYDFIIKDNAIIGGNFFPSYGLEIEEGAYIASRYEHLRRTLIETLETLGPKNKLGYKSSVGNNVILPGYTEVPAFAKIKSNIPLILQGGTLGKLETL